MKNSHATTLAYLLSKRGHRTALIDFDGQGHSSIIFGMKNPNKLKVTINTLLCKLIEHMSLDEDEPLAAPESYIIKTKCGVDLIPLEQPAFLTGTQPMQCKFPGTDFIALCRYHQGCL